MSNLKDIITYVAGAIIQTEKVLADDKIKFTEYFEFTDELMALPGIIQKAKLAYPDEFKAIATDDTFRVDLKEHFVSKFDLSNDKAERIIEKLVTFVIDTADGIQDIVAEFKA